MQEPSQGMEIMPPASPQYIAAAEARSLNFLNPKLWQAMGHTAQVFVQSGALPKGIQNAPQVIMMLQAGYEMGLQPVEALQSLCFINGKLSVYGEVAIALVVRQGHLVKWGLCNEKEATVTIKNKTSDVEMTNTFTMAQADARKINQYFDRESKQWKRKEPWNVMPENMLKFKAFHMTAKFVCPEAFHGVPMAEEIEEVEPTMKKVEATVVAPQPSTPRPTTSLEEALDAPEPPKPEKPLKASKTKPKEQEEPTAPIIEPAAESQATQPEAEAVKEPDSKAKEPEMTDEEKYNALVEKEMSDVKLTNAEKMWMGKYQAQKQNEA